MITEKSIAGQIGEEAATAYLKKRGYRILERNFKNKTGEIDIIAMDRGTLCFIEVKTRQDDRFGSPFEAVTIPKQRKLAKVAGGYLAYKGLVDPKSRFDVVAVMLNGGRCQSIEIVQNAFDAT